MSNQREAQSNGLNPRHPYKSAHQENQNKNNKKQLKLKLNNFFFVQIRHTDALSLSKAQSHTTMEPNEHQLSSYFNPNNTATAAAATVATTTAASPTNGLMPNTHSTDGTHMVYTHSVPSSAVTSPLEPAKRKRGRPRKYGTPEQALAAKKAATTSSHSSSSKEKKEQQHGSASPSYSGSTKKSQLLALGGFSNFANTLLLLLWFNCQIFGLSGFFLHICFNF